MRFQPNGASIFLNRLLIWTWAGAVLLVACAAGAVKADTRTVTDLSGRWDFLPVWKENLSYPPAKGEWKPTAVPEYWGGYPEWTRLSGEPPPEWKWTPQADIFRGPDKLCPFAWYRRTVTLPAVPGNRRVRVRFMAVAHRVNNRGPRLG